jgi:uncharacterized membrane protein YhfC
LDILVRLLNPLIMIALPLAAAAFLARRLAVAWRLFAVGAASFFVSQVLHIPFNIFVLSPLLDPGQAGIGDQVINAALVGLSAGVFEESIRYVFLRFWLKKARAWKQMTMFGLGHGGFESMLLGVLALYAFFQALALRGTDLATIVPEDQIQAVATNLVLYWDAPWHMALLGAIERVLAICLHLGLTALVWQAVLRKSLLWVGFAVIWHAAANAVALIINQHWGSYLAEGFLALMAGISVYLLLALRRRGPPPVAASADQPEARLSTLDGGAVEDVSERSLDESRYMD